MLKHTKRQVNEFVFQNAFYCHVCHRSLCVISFLFISLFPTAIPVFLLVLTIRRVLILFHCLWLVVMTFTEAMKVLTGKPRKDWERVRKILGYMWNLALLESYSFRGTSDINCLALTRFDKVLSL